MRRCTRPPHWQEPNPRSLARRAPLPERFSIALARLAGASHPFSERGRKQFWRFLQQCRVLKAIELTCERGGRTLFQGLSFELRGGELLRLGGQNGSGKTSLLRILCGLLSPSAGEVRWNDAKIHSLREDYAQALVYLGHAPAVKDDLSAAENLAIACRLAGKAVLDEQVVAALDRMGLARTDIPVKKLSQGQRGRAALARLALSDSTPLWLLDEPFSALDVAAAKVVEDLIAAHVAAGGAVVYTTHQEVGITASRTIELGAAT